MFRSKAADRKSRTLEVPPISSRRAERDPSEEPNYERKEIYVNGRMQFEYKPFKGIIPPEPSESARPRSNPVLRSQPLSPRARHRREDSILSPSEWDSSATPLTTPSTTRPILIPHSSHSSRGTPPPFPPLTTDRGPAIFPILPLTPPETRGDRSWGNSQNVLPFPSSDEPAIPDVPPIPSMYRRSRVRMLIFTLLRGCLTLFL